MAEYFDIYFKIKRVVEVVATRNPDWFRITIDTPEKLYKGENYGISRQALEELYDDLTILLNK